MNAQKGFTLIELMIVIAIIGILAAIAIPAYQDYIARAQASEALTLASGLKTPVSDLYGQNGTCPVNTSAAVDGIPVKTAVTGKYISSVETKANAATGKCDIVATFINSTGVSAGLKNQTITLTGDFTGGTANWSCTSTANQKYLPKACTGTGS